MSSNHEPPPDSSHIDAIVSSTADSAEETRHHDEQTARDQADDVRVEAEAEAWRLRHEAATMTAEHLAETKSLIDDFTAEQLVRISTLSDGLIEQLEYLIHRLKETVIIEQGLAETLASLGAAALEIAREVERIRSESQPPGTSDPGGS